MYRKGVAGLIINDSNEFLLVNLTSSEEIYYAIPGGGLEKGEEYEDAVIREIREELGMPKHSLKIVGKAKAPVVFEFKNGPMIRDGITYLG
jgi:ADP-ribose pyrophosphatase YjhB (NUDIX family)